MEVEEFENDKESDQEPMFDLELQLLMESQYLAELL
jgi:hypothetical protein